MKHPRKHARLLIAIVISWLPSAPSLAQPATTTQADRTRVPLAEIHAALRQAQTAPVAPSGEIRDALDEARDELEDERYADAIRRLEPLADGAGANVFEVQLLLAQARTRMGVYADARTAAEAAERLKPDDLGLQFLLGSLELERGQFEDAIPHYRAATELAGDLSPLDATLSWYYLARCLWETGYLLAAEQAYSRFDEIVFDTNPEQRNSSELRAILAEKPHGALQERVRLLQRLGEPAATISLTERALRRWPADPAVALLHGRCLLDGGRAAEAFALAHDGFARGPEGAGFIPLLVDAADATGRLAQVVDEVVRRLDGAQDAPLAGALARRLADRGAFAEAARLADRLRTAYPQQVAPVLLLASARRGQHDARGAIQALVEFVRTAPQAADELLEPLAAWDRSPEFDNDVLQVIQLERPPGDYAADFVLGVLAAVIQQPALADKLLAACVRTQPDFTPAYVARGELLLSAHDWEAAKSFAKRVLTEKPDLAAAHLLLARAHDGLDENEDAQREYREAMRLSPLSARIPLLFARHYRRLGELSGAERYFQDAFSKDPRNGEALEGLIDSYVVGRKVDLAQAQFDSANLPAIDPDVVRRCRTLLRFAEKPFSEEHLAELQSQAAARPSDTVTAMWLASALYENRRPDEAYDVLRRVCDLEPHNVPAGLQLAELHALRSELTPAIQRLETLRNAYPNRVAILQPLSRLLLYDFRVDEARTVLTRLMEVDATDTLAYQARLLETYEPFGLFEPALRLVEQWLEKSPNSDVFTEWRQTLLLALHREADALASARERLEAAPDDEDRRDRYVTVALQAKAYDEVIPKLREWFDADPSSADRANTLIGALNLAGRSAEALEIARNFDGDYQSSLLRRLWLAKCQEAAGDIDKAVKEYEALLTERLQPDRRTQTHALLQGTLLSARRFEAALTHAEAWLAEARSSRDPAALLAALRGQSAALQALNREGEYIESLRQIHQLTPGDVGVNNDLGYTWVDRGENLQQATAMIKYAFGAADPPLNAAYTDSLGWAYYKAGDFSAAHRFLANCLKLEAGRDAVIYDHFADTAWRLGDREDALANWRNALRAIEQLEPDARGPRETRLAATIQTKLKAAAGGEEPALAPTAAEQSGSESK